MRVLLAHCLSGFSFCLVDKPHMYNKHYNSANKRQSTRLLRQFLVDMQISYAFKLTVPLANKFGQLIMQQ